MILVDPICLLDGLLMFHRRAERHLATLAWLPAQLEAEGPTPHTAAAAQNVLACFDRDCARRHAEEERELLPLLERALDDGDQRARFRALRRALAEQHRGIERAWRELRRPLAAVGEGLDRRLEPNEIGHLRALFASHVHVEEEALHRVTAAVRLQVRHRSVTTSTRS